MRKREKVIHRARDRDQYREHQRHEQNPEKRLHHLAPLGQIAFALPARV